MFRQDYFCRHIQRLSLVSTTIKTIGSQIKVDNNIFIVISAALFTRLALLELVRLFATEFLILIVGTAIIFAHDVYCLKQKIG